MGIKRCPYCRALISDEDQYCKNCGTQLLFPEDEEIEEEIPGDKITEDNREREEEEENKEELTEEKWEKSPETEFVEKAEKEKETTGLGEEEEKSEEEAEEVILVEEEEEETGAVEVPEIKPTKEKKRPKSRPEEILFTPQEDRLPFPEEKTAGIYQEKKELGKTEEDLVKQIEKEVLGEEERKPEEASPERPGLVTQMVEELRQAEEAETGEKDKETKRPGLVTQMIKELGIEEKKETPEPQTFETAELDKIGPTVDLGKRQVDDFLKVLEEKEKERLREKSKLMEKTEEGTSEVPSWVKEVKTASTELLTSASESPEREETTTEDTGTAEEWLIEEKITEPTMGFPERVTRSQLEVEEKEEELTGELEMELETETETEEELEGSFPVAGTQETTLSGPELAETAVRTETAQLAPLGFKNFVKAKIFDLLLVTVFWLASIWLAARSMQTTIFKLLDLATNGLLVYLLILTFFYFFLFYFFIGETLGDRLFREGEEEEPF